MCIRDRTNAEKTLNKDHYGLEKVKERILEHLAVLKLKGDMKSPIICLYGCLLYTSVLQELHNSLYFCQTENTQLFDLAEPIP